ncbi:MAG: HAMP domain-containing sensor histidine kinase, partial [Ferruginibacter sp.]
LLTQDFSIWLNASQPGHIQEFGSVDLAKVIEEALEVYTEIIDKKGIVIQQVISTKFIHGDAPMIKSVIRNLIDNAIKNTASGSITITCRRHTNKEACEIIIADEGIGMDPERMEALNHFFQSGPDTLIFSASGFGHKVIKDFLHKLGGAIAYRQNHPSGIIVTVTLP